MNIYDDGEEFSFGDDDFFGHSSDSREENETRKKFLEDEVRRYRDEMRSRRMPIDEPTNAPKRKTFLSPEILEELINYCVENDKFEEALHFAEALTEHAPFSSDAWHQRAMLEAHHLKFDEALVSYGRALSLDPIDIEILINYGITLEALGRTDESLAINERVLAIDPTNGEALFSKASCYEKMEHYN